MDTVSPCPHFVYELVDPRDNSIFYVGITQDLYERYKQHMRCDGTNALKNQRIQAIVDSGHLPIMRTRERTRTVGEVLVREQYWIQFYLQQGVSLTNIASVPVDPQKPRVRVYKPHQIDPQALFFQAHTGRIVSVRRATDEEFDRFIKRYTKIHDDYDDGKWQSFQRRRIIAQLLTDSVQFDWCAPVEEKGLFFVKHGR